MSLEEEIEQYDLGFTINDLRRMTPVSYNVGRLLYRNDNIDIDRFFEFYQECTGIAIVRCEPEIIYALWMAHYTCDRSFPWFGACLETALKYADARTLLLCLYGYRFLYEEREEEEMDKDDALSLTSKNKRVLDILNEYIQVCEGGFSDLDSFHLRKKLKKWFDAKFVEYNISIPLMDKKFNEAKASL